MPNLDVLFPSKHALYAEATLKSTYLKTVSATTWSVCSRAKPYRPYRLRYNF
ncbi:MAG: hypothetical protein LBH59_08985 [Planctomycetaceae bacterium]|nr:hypothetical protein [Planctomycetaceae bacterium]